MDLLVAAMEERPANDLEGAQDDSESTSSDPSDATVDTAEASLEMSAANSLAFLRAPTGHLKGVRELSDGRYKAWGARDVPLGVFDDASTAALAVSRYVCLLYTSPSPRD